MLMLRRCRFLLDAQCSLQLLHVGLQRLGSTADCRVGVRPKHGLFMQRPPLVVLGDASLGEGPPIRFEPVKKRALVAKALLDGGGRLPNSVALQKQMREAMLVA
jgi:hypothetical protein